MQAQSDTWLKVFVEDSMEKLRCSWCSSNPLDIAYHDHEWGVPSHDEQHLFELLCLEGMQAGLSWLTILKKREALRQAFCNFDPTVLANLADEQLLALLTNPNIIRNRLKIFSVRNNAQAWLKLTAQGLSLDELLWSFTQGSPIQNHWQSKTQVPATTPVSDAMARELKKREFNFVGSTICYALMQASGIVNDHVMDCFRYSEVLN